MAIDPLVEQLAAGLTPVKPRSVRRDAVLLGLTAVAEIALLIGMGAVRPDMAHAMHMPSFWWKLASFGLLAAAGIAVTLRSLDPAASPRKGLRRLAGLVAVVFVLGWLVDIVQGGGGTALVDRLMWRHGLACVAWVVALSIPPIIALGLLMRRGAPTDRPGSALAIGIASAGWGAFLFSFGCPHDDPLYIAVWYAAGCAVVAGIGWIALPRLARW
jgi:hypothetical protein